MNDSADIRTADALMRAGIHIMKLNDENAKLRAHIDIVEKERDEARELHAKICERVAVLETMKTDSVLGRVMNKIMGKQNA